MGVQVNSLNRESYAPVGLPLTSWFYIVPSRQIDASGTRVVAHSPGSLVRTSTRVI